MIQLSVIVEYGCKIHLVCRELQNYLRKNMEELTGLYVSEIQVQVVGLSI
ncbi:Asp23/Gls24 family envelope stress response protein [Paenibacillus sp. UASWS1643]|nr:Asp23/Gls24 family envelope stress response protein [Paenibacillus sp. UASWS1643]